MDRNKRIAKVLGLKRDRGGRWRDSDGQILPVYKDGAASIALDVSDYLNSAEGKQVVRDRVKELVDRAYYSYGAVRIAGNKKHSVVVHTGGLRLQIKEFVAATEAEAWEKALIWLAERKDTK